MLKRSARKPDGPNRYEAILVEIFTSHYTKGITEFVFGRDELIRAASKLKIAVPKNLGDIVYSARYRSEFPERISSQARKGYEWIIEGAGRSRYRFKQVRFSRIVPNENLLTVKIPDATPEIIEHYSLDDEQALLAKVRYNRLIDIFLGITAFSLQNHLRSSTEETGQIEIDEVYIGVDRNGKQYIVPVQAKGGKDKHSVVQTGQDLALCKLKFPRLLCRAVSAQFTSEHRIAMFELVLEKGEMRVLTEKHYQLVLASEISAEDLAMYSLRED